MRLPTDARLPQGGDINQLKQRLYELQRDTATQVNRISEGMMAGATNAATAAPTSGVYAVGDFVRNSAPSVIATTTGNYTLYGWLCTAAPLTFVEVRYLTGGVTALPLAGGTLTGPVRAVPAPSFGGPGANWSIRAGLQTSGSYGGGVAFIDGAAGWLQWVSASGANWHIGQGTTAGSITERLRIDGSGNGLAGTDNAQTWGGASNRWSVIYAGTGAINTSDAREKTPVRALAEAEISAAKQLAKEIGAYKFKAAIALKGSGAREHIGLTVQRAIEIMQANGLAPFNYGFICFDAWQEKKRTIPAADGKPARVETEQAAGDIYGLRIDELLMFIARGFEARLSALEAP